MTTVESPAPDPYASGDLVDLSGVVPWAYTFFVHERETAAGVPGVAVWVHGPGGYVLLTEGQLALLARVAGDFRGRPRVPAGTPDGSWRDRPPLL